jgi:hypothetical protein
LNIKWKKIITGAALLVIFVIYTQYVKNAEPAWKVNTENFYVLDSLEELMDLEKMKYNELKFVDHFQLFKNSTVSVPLSSEQRTLRIEKTWNHGYQFYVLYSVDLKERDKGEGDIPKLDVNSIKLTSKHNNEFEGTAELYPGETATEGYVYRHRLYRSIMVYPNFNNNTYKQEDWEELLQSTRYELSDISVSSKKGVTNLKPIAFKVEPAQMSGTPKAIASSPVNKTINVHNGENIQLKNLEFFQIGSRITIEKEIDKDLVSFIGDIKINDLNNNSYEYEILGNNKSGYYLQTDQLVYELLNAEEAIEGTFTLSHSVHRNNKAYSFIVPKTDLEKFSANQQSDLKKNVVIVNEKDLTVTYEGLDWDEANNQGGIKFSMDIHHQQDSIEDFFMFPRPVHHFSQVEGDERFQRNLISVKDSSGKQVQEYDITQIYQDDKSSFLIYFYNGLPIEDLTVTLSRLTHLKPLKKEVRVPLKLSDAKTVKEK